MKKIILIAAVALGTIGLLLAVKGSDNPTNSTKSANANLTPVDSLRDAHGLAVDAADSSKLWIASHTGLHLLKNDKDLFLVGRGRDDYMGFSTHPTDPNTFFTSGHPAGDGNIGFQKSTDAGKTWRKVSDGLDGPVDFHSMAVDRVDPGIVYGMYQGQMQKSVDGGKSWKNVRTAPDGVIQLVAGATQSTLYAATQSGLEVSRDQGKAWTGVGGGLQGGAVVSVAANPKNDQELMSYSQQLGLAKSQDGGLSWTKLSAPLAADELVVYLAYDPNSPTNAYMLTRSLSIYKTTDAGASWTKVKS